MRFCWSLLALLAVWVPARPGAEPRAELVEIPPGLLQQGDPAGEPDEARRDVAVATFRMMRREVTNADFAPFVALDRLQGAGNGVCPLAAAYAYRSLKAAFA